jgi:hypothetical protein
MSKDKHKKRDRAYAFLRALRDRSQRMPRGVNPYGEKAIVSGPLPSVVRYCLAQGMATLRRTNPGTIRYGRSRHNLLDAE